MCSKRMGYIRTFDEEKKKNDKKKTLYCILQELFVFLLISHSGGKNSMLITIGRSYETVIIIED